MSPATKAPANRATQSAWMTFLAEQRKIGRTPKEASALWKARQAQAQPPGHLLDASPVGSKIVGTDIGPVIAIADGSPARMLPKDDLAARLPAGAKIAKIGPDTYRAEQLNPTDYVAPQHYPTTAAAIADFLPRFHHVKADG
ncbi:MAG: hypothetical protein KGI71_05460 [Patescibacteria group bacterium]|nr:hypothetical protein [Patescibacteria group bacterium]